MINCLHHFEILTNSSSKIIKYLVNGFNFNLIAQKQTQKYNQYYVNANSINFLITSLNENDLPKKEFETKAKSKYFYNSSLDAIDNQNGQLMQLLKQRKNTVFNAAFQVRDLDQILRNCHKNNVKILKNKHVLFDEDKWNNGFVECAMIESCIDGVIHSLFDLNNYKGSFLPGFEPTSQIKKKSSHLSHYDHITYATLKDTSKHIIDWYGKIFNMKRFKLNMEDKDGLLVKTGDSGMNLKVINHWLCAETGVEMGDKELKEGFKFVISEPFGDDQSDKKSLRKNQISMFLEEHGGPGIQHIGFLTNDIFETVKNTQENNEDVRYYITPDTYYDMVNYIFNYHFQFI